METPVVFNTSHELVKDLKKRFKSYKSLIKDNTNRSQYFPFVGLKKCPKLDKCSKCIKTNGFNESIDEKINKISQKLCESDVSSCGEALPRKRRKTTTDSVIRLTDINNENEELDFEEVGQPSLKRKDAKTSRSSDKTNGSHDMNGRHSDKNGSKLNGFGHRSEAHNRNGRNGLTIDAKSNLSVFGTNCLSDPHFKIPKKDSQNIESIVSHANSLANSRKRSVDAFNYLLRYLSEDQWKRDDVLESLASIATGMAANIDFATNLMKFNELVDKLKTLMYTDDQFWDQLIYTVDKKKNDVRASHQINSFLSGLYDFMMDNKISARVLCAEAVVIAFRNVTNHSSVKDLSTLTDL